jgi:hypothetical protein
VAVAYTVIKVSCGPGATLTVGRVAGAPYLPLAWSPDGSQLAWFDGVTVTVVAFRPGGAFRNRATSRHWACKTCLGVEFLVDQAVAVSQLPAAANTEPVTQLLEYPRSGTGPPVTRTVTGLPYLSGGEIAAAYSLVVDGTTPSGGIVIEIVAGGQGGMFNNPGVVFYHIDVTGRATEYGHYTVGNSNVRGGAANLVINPAGPEFGFISSGGCGPHYTVDELIVLLDTTTDYATAPPMPPGGGRSGYWPGGIWFDPSGAPHVSLVANSATCGNGIGSPYWPAGAQPIDCMLVGNRWVKTGSGVFQEAYGPGTWVAQMTGTLSPSDMNPGPVQIGDHLSGTTILTVYHGDARSPVTARNVISFAWAP